MQPYFVPYIGYWQLINAVDKYVIYDDVNYIKGGWINRNRILLEGEVKYFNVQMCGASPNKHINEISVNQAKVVLMKNIRILEAAYKKAPYFQDIFPLIQEIILCQEKTLSRYVGYSIMKIAKYLDMETQFFYSSELEKPGNLKGQEKVLKICEVLGGHAYINAAGGKKLYDKKEFEKKGLDLYFLLTGEISYQQFEKEFKEDLSIIDILMFNSKENVRHMLLEYSLI